MADERRESVQEREDRVRQAEEDRAQRAEKAPLTGVLTNHDVLRHLVHYGSPADPAARAELLAVIDKDDPDVKGQDEQDDQAQDDNAVRSERDSRQVPAADQSGRDYSDQTEFRQENRK